MRVLHVSPSIATAYGGPTQSLRGYVASARLARIDTELAAPQGSPEDTRLIEEEMGRGSLHLFRSWGNGAAVVTPRLWIWLYHNVRRYDVLHVHGLFNPVSSLSARIGMALGVPCIIRPFGTMSRYTMAHRRTHLKTIYLSLIERENIRRAAAVHFTSGDERREADWHRIPLNRALVIPPPYQGRFVEDHCSDGPPIVLFLGRIHSIKNLPTLLTAWRDVIHQLPAARLIIAGDGEASELAMLRARAAELGIADSVHFPGFVSGESKERLLRDAALLVLPSHHENLGIVLLEALAHGLPAVVSTGVHIGSSLASRGLARVWSTDSTSLSAALIQAASDRVFRAFVAQQGPALVRREYSMAATAEALAAAYTSVV